MLYQPALLAAALDCDTAALKVEYGLYNRAKTLSKAFRAATDWGRSGSGSGSGVKPRFDYTLQGATAARLPAVFFAHAGTEGGRSIDDRSVHTAFCNIFSDHLPVFVDLEFARDGVDPRPRECSLHRGPQPAVVLTTGVQGAENGEKRTTTRKTARISQKSCIYSGVT